MREGGVLVCAFMILPLISLNKTNAELNTFTQSMWLDKHEDVNFTVYVNSSTLYLYNITYPSLDSVPPRITVDGSNVSKASPVDVIIWHEKGLASWRIPLIVANLTYNKISRILCRGNDRYGQSNSKKMYGTVEENKLVRIGLTSSSPENIEVNVLVQFQYVPRLVVSPTNTSYYVPPIDGVNRLRFTPSEPWYYEFKWSKNSGKSVVIHVTALQNMSACMTLSIQRIACPVLDSEMTVGYDGYWQTIDYQGGVTIHKDVFPHGFYIVFILNGDDHKCVGGEKNPVTPIENIFQERSKNVSFFLYETINDHKLYMALAAPLVVYGTVCLCFLAGAIIYSCRAEPKPKSSTSLNINPVQTSNDALASQEARIRHVRSRPQNGSSDEFIDIDTTDVLARSSESLKEKKIIFVCDLARKDTRILRRKSDLYVLQLLTVAVFYSLPVAQLMFSYQKILHKTGNQDECYYNFLCSYPLITNPSVYSILDFNHVFSNVGYVILGLLFCAWTLRRDSIHKTAVKNCPAIDKLYGIPQHYGLFYAIGWALVMEGFLSACYHICPNKTNFQFDTSFMYIIAVLCMVKLYHNRHPDINASAYTIFFILALIIVCGMIGITESSENFFICMSVIHVGLCIWLSRQVYNLGQTNLSLDATFIKQMKSFPRDVVNRPREYLSPDYPNRFILLLTGNILNWLVIYVGWSSSLKKDFGSYMLTVLLANLMLYFIFYILMKLINGERLSMQPCLYFILSSILAVASSWFFFSNITSWKDTPAISRRGNKRCIEWFDFYDNHDVWHFLSAGGMFCMFVVLLTLDDDLVNVPRSEIRVF